MHEGKKIIIIAGPNGAGKTSFALEFLPREGNCPVFVNADLIAAGISPFIPETVSFHAGRIMIGEIKRHVFNGDSFAFETTLSGQSYVNLFKKLKAKGYSLHLFFLWLPSPELAILRVKDRVSEGGHNVPAEDVRRRFFRGIGNLFELYIPLLDSWMLFDNSGMEPELIAKGKEGIRKIINEDLFDEIKKHARLYP